MKQFLLKIYTWSLLSKERTNYYQKIARDQEWESIKPFLKTGRFLDIGAGAGYAMKKAQEDFNCEVSGIDPDPQGHGVGRDGSNYNIDVQVIKGVAEDLPFSEKSFDVVYSSHVLEHVQSISKSLSEMKRVVKNDGVIIIGVPTATMAWINWLSQYIFTTHFKLVNILFSRIINTDKTKWWEIFIPVSHSFSNKTILYDVRNYRIKNWEKELKKELLIKHTIKPCIYPYPQYLQLFKLRKNKCISSSVFFVCINR